MSRSDGSKADGRISASGPADSVIDSRGDYAAMYSVEFRRASAWSRPFVARIVAHQCHSCALCCADRK